MPLNPATAVYDLASDILVSVVGRFGDESITLPDRQYVHAGETAFDCIAAGTRITTERGAPPIEDVGVGDRVWSWSEGEMVLRDVTAVTPKGTKETLIVQTPHRTIHATPNHRFLVARPDGDVAKYSGWFRSPRLTWRPEWVAADALVEGDFLVGSYSVPDAPETRTRYLADGSELDEEMAWFLGLMVGDGNISRQGFACCVYGETRERVLELVERRWGYEGREHVQHGAYFYSPELRDLFTVTGLASRSTVRRVPDLIWASPRKIQQAFLVGYTEADGYMRREGYTSYGAASRELIADVRALHMAVGDQVSNLTVQERTRDIVIKGKQVQKARALHRCTVYPRTEKTFDIVRKRATLIFGERFRPERVRSVAPGPKVETYDLTVADTHNFIADGLVVHNCEQVTVTVLNLAHAFPGVAPEMVTCAPPRHVALQVDVIRCVPCLDDSGNAPSDSALDAAAQVTLTDMWVLAYHLHAGWRAEEWSGACSSVLLGAVSALGPEGCFGGVRAEVFVLLTEGGFLAAS